MSHRVFVAIRILALAVSFASTTTADASIAVDPECPAFNDGIVITATGPSVMGVPLSLVLNGATIKLVAQEFYSGFALPPATRVVGTLPPLAPGKYRIEFYTRMQPGGQIGGDPSTLLHELFNEAKNFEVFQLPPTCSPTTIEAVSGELISAGVGEPYPVALRMKVTDAHANPIPNFALRVYRWGSSSEPTYGVPFPDFAQPPTELITGADGIATFSGTASQTPGTFLYTASLSSISRPTSVAYATFYNRPAETLLPTVAVVEFVRRLPNGMQHFFMTGSTAEVAQLDRSNDWKRTGEVFMAFARDSGHAGASPVCRFYGLPSAGLDSHFFSASADECSAVAQRFGNAWQLETSDAFEVYLPDRSTGACPAQTRKLHRAYNNQPDANHRFALTHDIALFNAHPFSGPYWSLEGYGLDAVVMCLPQ